MSGFESEHLVRAKRAIDDAAELGVDLSSTTVPPVYTRLLDLAQVQAYVAIAEALERLVDGGCA